MLICTNPTTLVAAIAVGASKGALAGAFMGATVGAEVGYAITGTLDGFFEGAAIGFGLGSTVGAISGGVNAATTFIPPEAYDTLNHIDQKGSPPKGYKGGKPFANDGRNGGQTLPDNGTTYREYDIHPKLPGQSRGQERIVIGSDGSAWYTRNHYRSFIQMR